MRQRRLPGVGPIDGRRKTGRFLCSYSVKARWQMGAPGRSRWREWATYSGPRDMRAGPLGGPNRARAPCRGKHFIRFLFNSNQSRVVPWGLRPLLSPRQQPSPAALHHLRAAIAAQARAAWGCQRGSRLGAGGPQWRLMLGWARGPPPLGRRAGGGGGGGWRRRRVAAASRRGGVEQYALLRSGSSSAGNVSINCSVFRFSRSSCKVPRTSAGGCRSETSAASAVVFFVLANLAGLPLSAACHLQ
jgi:hypothetical protein